MDRVFIGIAVVVAILAARDAERRELAEGFARRERRRRAYLDVALVVALALAGGLTFAGVTHSSSFGMILAVYGLLLWARESLRNRQIKRRARSRAQPDPATAA